MDDVTWGALTLTLTLLGGLWTFYAFRNRGVASGLRGAGLTLLPRRRLVTGTLEMFTEIGGAVVDWATHLVFSPLVWSGLVLAGDLGAAVRRLQRACVSAAAAASRGAADAAAEEAREARRCPSGRPGKGAPAIDDDMADIEAILSKRGIT